MTTKHDLGEAVRAARKKARLTQEQLGKKIDPPVRKETISRLERGQSNYNIDLLFEITKVLGKDISELCPGEVRRAVSGYVEEAFGYMIKRMEEDRNKKGEKK